MTPASKVNPCLELQQQLMAPSWPAAHLGRGSIKKDEAPGHSILALHMEVLNWTPPASPCEQHKPLVLDVLIQMAQMDILADTK